jgi:hypothetical protein
MALGRGDLDAMCAAFFKISTVNEESDVEGFRRGMRELDQGWYETNGSSRRLKKNATLVMLDMLRLSRETGIYPERDVVKYIRSAIAIDGLITRVAPTFDLGRHLEDICHRHLVWHARQALFNYSTIANWAGSGGHMMESGFLRASAFLNRIIMGQVEASAEINRGETALRRRAIQLASVVFTGSLVMALGGDQTQLGINLFTAEVMLVVSAVLMLSRTIHRLTQEG